MDRIRSDRRHADIDVLLDREIFSREFGDWSMRRAGDDDASAYGTAFMLGFARGERSPSVRRRYEIVMRSVG